MSQQELFTTTPKPVHFTPASTPGKPSWIRISLCGLECSVRDFEGPDGCSDFKLVTCEECLRRAKR